MSWDDSYYDPTQQPIDGFRVFAAGGRSGPLALENGAKLSFPWARQQQAGGTPAEVWVREGTDPVNSESSQTLFVLGADVNDISDDARPKLRLDSYWTAGQKSTATLAAGDASVTLQTRVRVSTQRIDLETIPLVTTGGATDGMVRISGRVRAYSVLASTPSVFTSGNPLVIGARPLVGAGSFAAGAAMILGHNWIQAATTNVTEDQLAMNGTLNLQPAGGDIQIGGTPFTSWTTFDPVITQGATISHTVYHSKYIKLGKTVIWHFTFTATSAGTTGQPVLFTLPHQNASSVSGNASVGSGYIFIGGANALGQWCMTNSNRLVFLQGGGYMTTALASGNVLTGTVIYETFA